MKRSKFARRRALNVAILAPTPERHIHNQIIRPDSRLAIIDVNGARSTPYRALSTLDVLERNNTITIEMRRAGDYFHYLFRKAHLDNLHAADMERVFGGRRNDPISVETAKKQVQRRILLLGGEGAIPASCAWYVLGWELSLTAWALRQDWRMPAIGIRPNEARGVLLSALCVLGTLDQSAGGFE